MIALRYPLNYIAITSGYRTKTRPNHTGIDLGWNNNYGGANVDVYAPANGKVIQVINGKVNDQKNSKDAGNVVKIQHADGYTTRVIHLLKNSIVVKVGDIVYQGQKIAKMNNSGYSFGNHVHYDVWLNGKKVNPLDHTYAYDGQVINKSKEHSSSVKLIKDRVMPSETVYAVVRGDTLSKIASKYNTTYQELAKYNNISNPNLIKVGQKINIPSVDTKKYIQINAKSGVWAWNGIGFKNKKQLVIPYGIKCELLTKNVGKANGYNWDKIIYKGKTLYLANNWNTYL